MKAGDLAGHINNHGRRRIGLDRKWFLASRLAWLYMTGEWPVGVVDHKDRNKLNDKWSNLQDSTQLRNTQNQSLRTNNTSGHKGVYRCQGKWVAYITVEKKRLYVHRSTDIESAVAARKAAETHYGFNLGV